MMIQRPLISWITSLAFLGACSTNLPKPSKEEKVLHRVTANYCGSGFRLGEYPELVDEVVAESLRSPQWDLIRGKVKGDRFGGQNDFVAMVLRKSEVFSTMLKKCTKHSVFERTEKVFVSKLDTVEVSDEIKKRGQKSNLVPHDGIVYIR